MAIYPPGSKLVGVKIDLEITPTRTNILSMIS
jgi:hypothetical protein